MFPCYSLCSSHLSSPPCVYKSVLYVCPTNWFISTIFLSAVQFSHSVVSDSLWPHGLQHARPPCPSPIPRVCLNSCPSSQWCHPTISFSVVPFSFCLQSFTVWRSFSMSQFFISGGVSASTSVLPMKIQDSFPLGLIDLIYLKSKGLSRVFSNTTVHSTFHIYALVYNISFPLSHYFTLYNRPCKIIHPTH